MEFTLNLVPNQQAIFFVDQIMESYTTLYELPYKKELCFVVHELVINAVEAMQNANTCESDQIQIHVSNDTQQIKVTVIDMANGIPKENWENTLQFNPDEFAFSERGRGLFFVKNMVDNIWFEYVSESQFLVGISKNIKS